MERGDEIKITLVDELKINDPCTFYVSTSVTLKAILNQYADKLGVSLRTLRFGYEDRTIFLSSLGQQTLGELGFNKNVSITVMKITGSSSTVVVPQEKSSNQTKKVKARRSASTWNKSKGKGQKKSVYGVDLAKGLHEDKVRHSQLLTRLFEEAESKFKKIQDCLNAQNIERQEPKDKARQSQSNKKGTPVFNPSMVGVGAKAGVSRFIIQVGEVENLYKTRKPSIAQRQFSAAHSMKKLDLHGCNQEEALIKLDEASREWNTIAMNGPYPWVIPAIVICGCGNQVLSETVENWIKETRNVCKVPKSLIPQMRIE